MGLCSLKGFDKVSALDIFIESDGPSLHAWKEQYQTLIVQVPQACWHCGGVYDFLGTFPTPHWKKSGQADAEVRYLYRGSNGMWYIDGAIALAKRFQCNEGFIRALSSNPTAASWERGDEAGKWLQDASIVVTKLNTEALGWRLCDGLPLPEFADAAPCPFFDGALVHEEHLPQLELGHIRSLLDCQDWAIHKFLLERLQVSNLTSTPFVPDPQASGTRVRRCRFLMPLPQEVPSTIAAVIGIPAASQASVIYSLWVDTSEITLVQRSVLHDIPYGESFRTEDTVRFTRHRQQGVDVRKWTKGCWLQPLPWTMSVLESYVEQRAELESQQAAHEFAWFLQEMTTSGMRSTCSTMENLNVQAGAIEEALRTEFGLFAPLPSGESLDARSHGAPSVSKASLKLHRAMCAMSIEASMQDFQGSPSVKSSQPFCAGQDSSSGDHSRASSRCDNSVAALQDCMDLSI